MKKKRDELKAGEIKDPNFFRLHNRKLENKIVVVCGSSRFADIMSVCQWLLEKEENAITMGIHFMPVWYSDKESHIAEHEGVAEQMDELHKRKIDLADEVFIVDYDNYIGDSTTSEMQYAAEKGVKIRKFSEDEVGRKILLMLHQHEDGKNSGKEKKNIFIRGYQPKASSMDRSEPPKGGSGVASTNKDDAKKRVKIELDLCDLIELINKSISLRDGNVDSKVNSGLWSTKYDEDREAMSIIEVDAHGNTLRLIAQMPSDKNWEGSSYIGEQIVDEHNHRLSSTALPIDKAQEEFERLIIHLNITGWNDVEETTFYGFFLHGWLGRTNDAKYQE